MKGRVCRVPNTKKQSTQSQKNPISPKGKDSSLSASLKVQTASKLQVKTKVQPQTMTELLAWTGYAIRGVKRGDLVEGVITSISHREILIDLGVKTEGIVSDRDFSLIADLLKTLNVGDKVLAYVVNPEDEGGRLILSLRKAGLDYKWKAIDDAKVAGELITVRGLEVNRGGLLVDCQGLRGFIPASQLDVSYANRPQELAGQNIQVKILEAEQKNNRLIFSQKLALTKEAEAKIRQKLAEIKIGSTCEGVVSNITPFGLFVNFDGLEGLVHISEIAWEKINDIKDYFKIGDKVKVLVLEIDSKTGRLNLSIKKLLTDPYDKLSKLYDQEKLVKGKVVKLTNFGIFVRMDEGIEGLIHVSKIPPGQNFQIGEEVECLIEAIDAQKRKISLSPLLKEKPVGYK